MKKRKGQEYWFPVVEEYLNREGERADEWCKKKNLTPSSLRYWVNKYNKEQNTTAESSIQWMAVDRDRTPSSSMVLHVDYYKVSIKSDFDPQTLKQLIRVLRSC